MLLGIFSCISFASFKLVKLPLHARLWDTKKQRYCCYKYKRACTTQYVKQYHYHTVVHKKEVPVEVAKTVAACLSVEGLCNECIQGSFWTWFILLVWTG